MASSMPTGDRRWAPARKSGMTVLGKVPKPINLPSQRLENHGLDPNVEIVPKGTLTWGSRPSTAGTNAWGTSSLSSPHADGSAGSPTFGRPSSGETATRPSTAGSSDRSHEPVSNAWDPNPRPSSASGILAFSQLSAAASRPRSAETRPCSSQLSRFAESSIDNTVARGATGTAERLGNVSSKTGGFSLSSGDFPTLGSEKNSDSHSQRGHSSQGRPTSASGTVSTAKETLEGNRNTDHSDGGNVNTWKAENHPYVGDATSPVWHKDPKQAQSYTSVNMPPHQFDSWHNPPFHQADRAWYRGGPPVGPYRPPGPPGGYFDYPHVSARPLPNTQAGPRPEGSSVGYCPNSGEPFQHLRMPPEPFMGPNHSNMPLRPGPYPVQVPYDGYYGPPQAGFYNINEKGPLMPMVRPVVYNQYPTQNPNLDPGRYHARPGGYLTSKNVELMKSDQTHENQGQLRVLLKQHDSREDCEVQGKGEQPVMGSAPHLERGNQPGLLRLEGDLQTKNQKPEPAEPVSLSSGEAASSLHTSGLDSHSGTYVKNSLEDSMRAADDGLIRREEATNVRVRDRRQYPAVKKNSTLIEKGEGLNIKARVTDGQNEPGVHSLKERTKAKDGTNISDQSTTMVVNVSTSNVTILVPNKLNVHTEEKNRESSSDEKVLHAPSDPVGASGNAHFQAQKRGHGFKGVDHRAKLKSNRHENDDWMKKSPEGEPSVTIIGVSGKGGPKASPLECATSLEALKNHGLLHATNAGDGSYSVSSLVSVDHKAQRAKLKEIAMQRAKQLEEERTREQKAKPLAKLEDLNRRALAESSSQKLSHPPPTSNDVPKEDDDSGTSAAPETDMHFVQVPGRNLTCDSKAVRLADDDAIKNLVGLSDMSSDVVAQAQASDSAIQTSNMLQTQSLSPSQETISKKSIHTTALDMQDTSSKHKQLGYRRRPSMPQDKSMGEKQITPVSTEVPKNTGEVGMSTMTSDISAHNDDHSVHHRKHNSRGARNNKNKLDDVLPGLPSPHTEGSSGKVHTESIEDRHSGSVVEAISVPYESLRETVVIQSSREVPVIPLNQGSSESNEESHSRVTNNLKPHPQRKFTKNQQANKPVPKYHGGSESVIWAVKPPNKIEPSEEVSKSIVTEATYLSVKSGHGMQSGIKTKRAEMERYVPKPVVKELSQQVNAQQSSPSTQAGPGNMTGRPDSLLPTVEYGRVNEVPVGKANFAPDIRNGENSKHNRGKISASWRQRSFTEYPPLEGSLSFNSQKTIQKASDQLQPPIVDSLPKGNLTNIDDGWNDNNDSLPPLASVTSTAVVKNVGVNRQRRQPCKVQSVPGSTYPTSDNMDAHRGMADKSEIQSPITGLNDSNGGKVMSNESQNVGTEHTRSHWQPKSQAYSYHERQGNRSSGGQRVSAQGTEHNVQNEHKNALNPNSFAAEARHHQGGKRETKVVADLSKDNMTVDLAADVNPQHRQPVTFGDNRQGHHGNRFQRGQDSGYRGKAMGQDDSKKNFYMNGDEQKDSSHLEFQHENYHKTGEPYQKNPVFGGAHEGSRASGSRYRERSRHHSRGGPFYEQSSGPPHISNYNSGE